MLTKLLNVFREGTPNAILTRGSASSFIIQSVGAGLALLLNITLARILGSNGYGEYIYCINVISLLTLFGSLGFNGASIRFIPTYMDTKDYASLRGFLITSFTITVFSSLFIFFLFIIILILYKEYFVISLYSVLFMAAFLIPINSLTSFLQYSLRSFKKITLSLFPESIAKPLLLVIVLISAHSFLGESMSPQTAMLINASIGVVIGTAMAIVFYKSFPPTPPAISPNYKKKTWVRVALPFLFVSGLNLILSRIDIIMLGTLASTEAAGVYAIASRIAGLGAFFLTAVNTVAAPMISELYSDEKRDQLQSLLSYSVRIIFFGSILFSTAIIIFHNYIIMIFGSEFAAAKYPLFVLMAAQVVNASCGSVGFLLMMTGHQNQALIILTFSAIINVVLNAILIPHYGALGAAIATATSMFLWNSLMLFFREKSYHWTPRFSPFSD